MIVTSQDGSLINFSWDNGKFLGYAYREVDGFYVFQFADNNGVWPDYALKEISDKLFELNKEWNDIIQNDSRITKKIIKTTTWKLLQKQ